MGNLNSNAIFIPLSSLESSLNQFSYKFIAKESSYIKGGLIGLVCLSKDFQSSEQPAVLIWFSYNMNIDAVFINLESAEWLIFFIDEAYIEAHVFLLFSGAWTYKLLVKKGDQLFPCFRFRIFCGDYLNYLTFSVVKGFSEDSQCN